MKSVLITVVLFLSLPSIAFGSTTVSRNLWYYSRPADKPTEKSRPKPVNYKKLTYKPTYKPTEKPMEKPTPKPVEIKKLIHKPTYAPTSKPTYATTHKPTYALTYKPTYMPTYKPT
jgi:hypothetical protein